MLTGDQIATDTSHSRQERKTTTKRGGTRRVARPPRLPDWLIPELRPLVREAALRGGLRRVQALLFLQGRSGARVNMVHTISAGCVQAFFANPWPAAVFQNGGSLLIVFERADDARVAQRTLNAIFDAAQRIGLAAAPAEGSA